MVNYGYIFTVLSDPLGLGWDLFKTADYHLAPIYPELIPVIQGIILLAGLYLGISRGFLGLNTLPGNQTQKVRAMLLPSLFALFAVNVLLKLCMG